jgi:DNA adenine methylase
MQPFLKWPGGKRWFASSHADLIPTSYKRYIEPLLGSCVVFFRLKPYHATRGDLNADLIAVYRSIKKDWAAVVRRLRRHQRDHDRRYYYQVRADEPADPIVISALHALWQVKAPRPVLPLLAHDGGSNA